MTLLEVLLAVSLLGLLSVGMVMSIRVGIGAMGRTSAKLTANRRMAGAQRILEQQLQGLLPAVAACAGQRRPFFEGEPQSMRFVSGYSIEEAWRGRARVLEFQVIPVDRGRGVRLVVNEHLYAGPVSLAAFCRPGSPVAVGPQSFVLADRLESCRFVYQEPLPPPGEGGPWRADWRIPKWPRAIRVEMTSLDDDATRLRPLTVTAAVHVNRYPVFDYGDF